MTQAMQSNKRLWQEMCIEEPATLNATASLEMPIASATLLICSFHHAKCVVVVLYLL